MFRTLVTTSSRTLRTSAPARQFSLSTARASEGRADTDKKHAVNKAKDKDTANIQESNAKDGMDSANKSGTGGHATEERDSRGAAAKTKKEFPEAPDTIGMQDERGGRGA